MSRSFADTMDDAAAVRLFAEQGDPRAFELIARRYGAMVLATCRRVLVNESDAEDAAQETFFKLTQNASGVRSNVAAWLHAAAHGTSVDAVRRGAARRRAERLAADGGASDPAAMTWREMEGLIDAALEELGEADRELIVSRFLSGRTQRDLASAAGVAEGTMSRRVDRSLGRLRAVLVRRGCVVAGPLGAALLVGGAQAAKAGLPTALAAGLGKAGLSGLVSTGSGGVGLIGAACVGLVGVGLVSVVGAGLIGLFSTGGLGAPAFSAGAGSSGVGSGGSFRGVTTRAAGVIEPGPDRLDKEIGPFVMMSATETAFGDRGIRIGGRRITVNYGTTEEGEPRRATLRIEREEATDDGVLLTTRVERITPIDDAWSRYGVGRLIPIEASLDTFGRLVLAPQESPNGETVQIGRNEPRFFGVRPPKGWEEYGQIPEDAGRWGLEGPWTEAERIQVRMNGREIRFGGENWTFANYRIVEWERREGYSRVMSVNAGGRDPRQIGTRFRLLLREEPESAGGGYTVAYFPPGAAGDRWPTSFEFDENNPVHVVRIGGGS
ncbi:MAG: sigma-70 family RNA polymerase sigma factor [Planctomycetota bacterium]